ncbi:MAG: hypothetical protein Alis3KO_32430 [Aliiglaciecola sp.]
MPKIQCENCHTPIGFINVFIAGWPTRITCGSCSSNVILQYNPYILYPIVFFAFAAFVLAGFLVGNIVVNAEILPFKERHIRFGGVILAIVLLEAILSLWILYGFKTRPSDNAKNYKFANKNRRTPPIYQTSGNSYSVDPDPKSAFTDEEINFDEDIEMYFDVFKTIVISAGKPEALVDYEKLAEYLNQQGTKGLFEYVNKEFDRDTAEWFTCVDDEDGERKLIPFYLFESLLSRLNILIEADWKLEPLVTELFHRLNILFTSHNLEPVSPEEYEQANKALINVESNSAEASKIIKEKMDTITESRGKRLLWLDKNSDSVVFLLVDDGCFSALSGRQLQKNIRFK